MCAGVHHPTRGGTRGGKDQFDWEDVKTDKDRECYLGHSLMAPVGRWQKGRDLTWYTKKSKIKDYNAILEAERAAVKRAEEDAMAAALGLKPSVKQQQPLSRQEAAEVFRRQSQDDQEGGEERMKGVGFSGSSRLRKRVDSSSNDLGAIFEHDTADDVRGSVSTRPETTRQQLPDSTTPSMVSDRDKLKAKLKAYLDKKAKSKKKKKSSKEGKKSHRKRRASTSSSDSEDEWVEAKSSDRRNPRPRPHSRSESEERRDERSHRHTKRDHKVREDGHHSRSREHRRPRPDHRDHREYQEHSDGSASEHRGSRKHRGREQSPPPRKKRSRYEH